MSTQLLLDQRSYPPVPKPAPIYSQLRNKILGLSPAEINLASLSPTSQVWGILMEIGYKQAAVTLVSLVDGTTSLYFGTGGGILGGGGHARVAQATQAFLAAAEAYFHIMSPTTAFPLPCVGRVRFYALTLTGALSAECEEDELAVGDHALSALFYFGQEVLTQLSVLQQAL